MYHLHDISHAAVVQVLFLYRRGLLPQELQQSLPWNTYLLSDTDASYLSAADQFVGGIASDASEAVLQSAKLLRATAGTFGILAVLALVLVPFFRITICYLTMKLTAAIAGFAAGKEHAALIDAQSSAMGYVLGMTGSAALMLLFSTCCFMKVASG